MTGFSRLAAVTASATLAFNGVAFAASEAPLQASYPNDGALTCAELLAETGRMEQIMGISSSSASKADGAGRAAELGSSVAVNGMLYSGALGAMPGVGMFANGAGMFAKRAAAAKKKEAEDRMRTAETRRAIVLGLYQGKNCAAQTVAAPAPAPAETPAPAAVPVAANTQPAAPTP